MKITVEQSKLAKALNSVSKVAAGGRTTLPILSNVLVKAEKNKVTLTATNLDMAIVDFLPASNIVDGDITVPARLFADFVSNLPKGEVNISTKDDKVEIAAGKYKSIINGVAATDFPELPEIDEKNAVIYKIPVDDFKDSMNMVKIAASNDTTRPELTGIYFNTNDGALYAAAIDGYRLAEKKLINKVSSDVKAIVPAAAINEVLSALSEDIDEVEMLFDESQVRFRLGEVEITSKYIDGSYPDYRKIIPSNPKVEIVVDKTEMTRVVKLAALFARGSGDSITLEASKENQNFKVYSVANEYGENDSAIETEVSDDFRGVYNSRYIQDVLNSLTSAQVKIGYSSPMEPLKFTNTDSDDYVHIVMPVRG